MIIVVDDDVSLLDTIRDVLTQDGHQVEAFSDPAAALARMDSGLTPALIVSDVRMPGMDGFEFHREVTQRFGKRAISFLFLSSLDDPDHIVTGLESGADDYMTKPIDWRVLKAKVRSVLSARTEQTVPVFTGDLSKLPFVKLLQFCELRALTGEIRVSTPDFKATVPLQGGLLQEDDETMDLLGQMMDMEVGEFEIFVQPPDFSEIQYAAKSPRNETHKPADCPAGILTGIQVGERLVQVQTECVSHPSPSVVTVAILDGRTLTKKVLAVEGFSDKDDIRSKMRQQHRDLEQDFRKRLTQKVGTPNQQEPSPLERFNQLFEQGLSAYRAGNFEGAMAAWTKASEVDPDNKVVQVNLTMLKRKLSNQ